MAHYRSWCTELRYRLIFVFLQQREDTVGNDDDAFSTINKVSNQLNTTGKITYLYELAQNLEFLKQPTGIPKDH
jgi:hypothetical protein